MQKLLTFPVMLVFAATALAQKPLPIKVRVIYDTSDASSSAVVPILVQKIAGQPKLFAVVNRQDEDKDMSVVADCYKEAGDTPYSCFYTASKWRNATQAFLGGAIVVKKSADDAATALFASIVQDISERWNSTDHRMLVGELEACLALTESSCAVPEPLIPELKAKTINLSQYARKGGLKP